jgi:hypothetical protein
MPKTKAIVIPDWVKNLQKNAGVKGGLYQLMPAMMHWQNADLLVVQLVSFTPGTSVRVQLRDVVDHLKQLMAASGVKEEMVASVIPLKNIPYQLMVQFAPDVKKPGVTGQIVLRVDIHGDIIGIEREYTMNYTTPSNKK